jgi:hypothetical protein
MNVNRHAVRDPLEAVGTGMIFVLDVFPPLWQVSLSYWNSKFLGAPNMTAFTVLQLYKCLMEFIITVVEPMPMKYSEQLQNQLKYWKKERKKEIDRRKDKKNVNEWKQKGIKGKRKIQR